MTGSTKPNRAPETPLIIGVAGGSGSGKTHFARDVQKRLGASVCDILYQDSFYIDQSQRFDGDGGSVNFDHPDAIDFALLAKVIVELKSGTSSKVPVYDFVTHSRLSHATDFESKAVILVDGILIFHAEPVRKLFDDLLFFETSEELRYQRRLDRDVRERGRTPEGVKAQFLKQVKPMHDQFVEPSKRHAKSVIQNEDDYSLALGRICLR